MGLAINLREIGGSAGLDPASGLVRRTAYGRTVSLSHAIFPPGYASPPHGYEGEEVSQLIEGELSVYLHGKEYTLKAGDIIRIPAMAVHWKRNRSAADAVMLELHSVPLGGPGAASLLDPLEREDASFGGADPVRFGRTYAASALFARGEEDFPAAPADDPLAFFDGAAAWEAAPGVELDPLYGTRGTVKSLVVGAETLRLMIFERAGLRSVPHFHAAEQITFILSGTINNFFDDRVVISGPGDFMRVPGNIVHWALVETGEKVVNFEVQAPNQGNPANQAGMRWLVPEHERASIRWIPPGFSTASLDPDELEAHGRLLIAAEKDRLRLQASAPTYLTPSGAPR